MKRPSFQFYPGDWMRDSALRSCSVGARGIWMDMLCLMHEGTPYGYLKVNLKVILPANLARIVGATLAETEGWLAELESAGVFSRAEDGSICSRRMIRDENIRESRASGGKLGGNPALKDNHKVAVKVNLPPNLKPTPSSSSSSSVSNNNTSSCPKSALPPLDDKKISPKPETHPNHEAEKFVDWFLSLLSETGAPVPPLTKPNRYAWADAYDKMVRLDARTKEQVKEVCRWARNDKFWAQNFMSPSKLRDKKDGVMFFDQFLNKMGGSTRSAAPEDHSINPLYRR